MISRLLTTFICLIATAAYSQEMILNASDRKSEAQTYEMLRNFYAFLPKLLKAGPARSCEFYQYPVSCFEVVGSQTSLYSASNKYLRSFPLAWDSELESFVNIHFSKFPRMKSDVLRFFMIAPPRPPAIPFIGYDARKSAFSEAIRGDADDAYVNKVTGNNFEPDLKFDKGYSIAAALEKSKTRGFNFFERDHDDYMGLTFPAFLKSTDIEAGALVAEYWEEFYRKSQDRTLDWGNDCSRCSIIRKVQISPELYLLSYCSVEVARGSRGVPTDCAPMVYVGRDVIWLRATATFEYPPGLGGVPSGNKLSCKPSKEIRQNLTWVAVSDDVTAVITKFNYIPSITKSKSELKFINEFRQSKLDPKQNEWTTVSVEPADVSADGAPVAPSGFSLSIDLNFSLRNEVDRTRYRPSSPDEEISGLQTLGSGFKERYSCSLIHE